MTNVDQTTQPQADSTSRKVLTWAAGVAALALVATNALDVWTTEVNFTLGGGEANPLMAALQAALGHWWWTVKSIGVLMLLALAGFAVWRKAPIGALAALVFLMFAGAAVYGLVVKDNFSVMHELRGAPAK